MSELYPGLRRAAAICTGLALECDAKVDAKPHSPSNARRKAESRALRRAASRITDAMLDEPLPVSERLTARCRRVGCITPTTHPSGMCEDHQPGFAQADEAEAA